MKKTSHLLLSAFLSMPQLSQASFEYKYEIQPNKQISQNCKNNGTQAHSRVQIQPLTEKQTALFTPVFIRLRLCLNSWGYQKINLTLNLPTEVFDYKELQNFKIGERRQYANIPSTKDSGKLLKLEVSRLFDKDLKISSQTYKSQIFQIHWLSSHNQKPEYLPLTIYVITEAKAYENVIDYHPDHLPWRNLDVQLDHNFLKEPLMLASSLIAIEKED